MKSICLWQKSFVYILHFYWKDRKTLTETDRKTVRVRDVDVNWPSDEPVVFVWHTSHASSVCSAQTPRFNSKHTQHFFSLWPRLEKQIKDELTLTVHYRVRVRFILFLCSSLAEVISFCLFCVKAIVVSGVDLLCLVCLILLAVIWTLTTQFFFSFLCSS